MCNQAFDPAAAAGESAGALGYYRWLSATSALWVEAARREAPSGTDRAAAAQTWPTPRAAIRPEDSGALLLPRAPEIHRPMRPAPDHPDVATAARRRH
jgi:hypothetical protein